MAQHFIDFETSTLGVTPSEFASQWASLASADSVVVDVTAIYSGADLAAMGDRAFGAEGFNNFDRIGWEWVAGSSSDEIRTIIDVVIAGGSSQIPNLILRGFGEGLEGTRTGYTLWIRPGSGNFHIRKVVSGSETTLASGTLPSLIGVLADVEFTARTSGSDCILEARYWEYGDARPVTATLTYTDISPLSVGWCGPGTTSQYPTNISYFGQIGVGTNGDAAPTAPIVVTGITLTSITPTTGPAAGGTTVTMTGTGFEAGTVPKFNGVAATSVVIVSPTELTCVTPAL